MVVKMRLDAVRRSGLEQQMSAALTELCVKQPKLVTLSDGAAKTFIAQALQDGFTLGRGVRTICMASAVYGTGFLRDAQYPQLAALFREDIRADEAWRLALFQQWSVWQYGRGQIASVGGIVARLHAVAHMLRRYGEGALASDRAALFHAIDPDRATQHEARFWHEVSETWRAAFTHIYPTASSFQIDYACALAFCCGQYFCYDPLWQHLGDLNPDTVFSFVS